MSENEQRPPNDPYGSQPPTNPYGQPLPSPSPGDPTPEDPSRHDPYGQAGSQPGYQPPAAPAYGSSPQPGYGQGQEGHVPQGAPYGQPGYGSAGPYGTDPYGVGARRGGDNRPGTVTAAGWITIVLSALSALFFGLMTLAFLVVRDPIIDEIEKQQEFQELDIQATSIVGVMLAIMLVLALWSAVGVLLGIFVLRRSNVARILLVISSAVVALISLVGITSGLSAVTLVAAIAVIALLFVGGAGDWFGRKESTPYGGSPYGGAGGPYGGGHQQP